MASECFATTTRSRLERSKAISEAGLRIPNDIAVVGAGNVHYFDVLAVPLTTVDQCTAQIRKQAAEILMEQIGAKRKPRIKKILITPKLVVRQSTQRRTRETRLSSKFGD